MTCSNKILIISKFSSMGGTRTFYNNLMEYMITKNKQLHIVFINDVLDENQIKILKDNNITYKILRKNKPQTLKLSVIETIGLLMYCFYFSFKHKVEKIIITQWGLNSDFLTLPILLLKNKIVLFVHSQPYTPKKFRVIWKLIRKTFSSILNKNHRIITVSNHNKKKIEEEFLEKEFDVKVLHNYSNIEKLKKEDNDNNEILTILTLGHVRDYKNPDLWLKVAREITKTNKNVRFIWAGEGELLERFKTEITNDQNISFLGYQSDVASLYKKTDIYLQLSKIESQGISVLDAMQYSIPCVVSNRGGLPESVVDNETGFVVDIDNFEEIIEKLNILINNKNIRIKMGENGSQLYNEKFSKEKWYTKLDYYLNF